MIKNFKLFESSLTRISQHIQNNQCAIISGERDILSKNQNSLRNKSLKKDLLDLGYSVTPAKGVYLEYYKSPLERPVKEESFFVSNINNASNFFFNIKKLSYKYDQESVLLIEPGGMGWLFGTSFDSDFLDFGQKEFIGYFKPGKKGEFMTMINGRPFIFN